MAIITSLYLVIYDFAHYALDNILAPKTDVFNPSDVTKPASISAISGSGVRILFETFDLNKYMKRKRELSVKLHPQ